VHSSHRISFARLNFIERPPRNHQASSAFVIDEQELVRT
jgi:hypothetical protein